MSGEQPIEIAAVERQLGIGLAGELIERQNWKFFDKLLKRGRRWNKTSLTSMGDLGERDRRKPDLTSGRSLHSSIQVRMLAGEQVDAAVGIQEVAHY